MAHQMLSAKEIKLGDLKGTVYYFNKIGDVLPEHTHDENSNHITIVTNGKIRAFNDVWSQEASAGEILDFQAGQPHAIEALEDNTKIYNILKKYGGTVTDPI